MLHPESLPRASTVSMTKEYSFMRTSVPRGPKLGSLGIPAPREHKVAPRKAPHSSRIHSLADYRSPEAAGGGETGAGGGVVDTSSSSLQSTRSMSSTVSEVSTASETYEVDVARPDCSDGDSSSYSSMSIAGAYAVPQGAPYTVNGQELAPEEVGRFPSLREVLHAAEEEQRLQEPEEEVDGEPRSRRDSFSSRCVAAGQGGGGTGWACRGGAV